MELLRATAAAQDNLTSRCAPARASEALTNFGCALAATTPPTVHLTPRARGRYPPPVPKATDKYVKLAPRSRWENPPALKPALSALASLGAPAAGPILRAIVRTLSADWERSPLEIAL